MTSRDSGPRSRIARRLRLAVPIGLAGALALSACAPIATMTRYDPADGIGADLGSVLLRNVLVVTNEDGSVANVTFMAINQGEPTTLNYAIPTERGLVEDSLALPSGSTLVGERAPNRIEVDDPDAEVGGLLAVTVQAGDADTQTLLTPVLDLQGRPYLAPFVP